MQADSPIPDPAKIIRTAVRDIEQGKAEQEKKEKSWAELGRSVLWGRLLKPYLKDRITSLKLMTEVNLSGRETVSEVGTRFLLCSAIAGELQSLIDLVEQTRWVMDAEAEKKKRVAEAELKKKLRRKKK